MGVLEQALGGSAVVIEFPRTGVQDWMAVAEVLLQEGLRVWSVPSSLLHLMPELLAVYGRRARVGVSGVVDREGVRAAADACAHFLLAPIGDPGLVQEAGPIPLLLGGLTPVEVAAAVRAGAEAVLVSPADVMGSAYARTLPPLFPHVPLVACGRLERYQCEMWLDAGARAVVVQDVVVRPEDGSTVNDVDEVARRAAPFGQLVATRGF
ncbi:MAG: hypothetical protein ACLGHZ_03410 [Actinomycetes bacterium]